MPTCFYDLVIATLLTWLAILYLVYEDGPPIPGVGRLFSRIREAAGISYGIDLDGEWVTVRQLEREEVEFDLRNAEKRVDGFFAKLLDCHRCSGFWMGLVIGLLFFGFSVDALAVPAAAILLHEVTNR